MRPVNLGPVADELYALTPAEFRAARDDRAARERAAGRRDLATAISKFRRPTVSAWLVNQLAREAPDEVARLLDLGESLRAAHEELAGERLRELSERRRHVIGSLISMAKRIASRAGQSVTAQVEREVLATFEAALAEPQAGDAVRSGCLTTALSYVGLGGINLADAVAVAAEPSARPQGPPGERGATAGTRPARRKAPSKQREGVAEQREGVAGQREGVAGQREAASRQPDASARQREEAAARRAAREAEAAESDLREAAIMVQEAADAVAEANRRVAGARERQEFIRRRIEQLEQQLAQAEVERAEGARSLREHQRERDAATRAADAAERRLTRAQARADRHR